MSAVTAESKPVAVASHEDAPSGAAPFRARRRGPDRLTFVVLLIGLLVTVPLAALSRINYLHNERHIVSTQAQLASSALAAAPVDVQRRLGRAAAVAAATNDLSLFDTAMKPSVPAPFVSVELFKWVDGAPQLVRSVGDAPMLDPSSQQQRSVLDSAHSNGSLGLTWIATSTAQHFGYAMSVTVRDTTYIAYAEQLLPGNRHVDLKASSPLSDMDFALYYGKTQTADTLIETNMPQSDLPIRGGTRAPVTVPFGDQVLTGVLVPRSPLLGSFAASMAWIIAGGGLLLTLIMALLTERLARRRAVAEQLVAVTGELYRTQRGVAQTLQTALLPKHMPRPEALSVATRYLAGTEGIEVGGDWYDLVTLPGNRMFFTIGDVSGRGLSAATMMSRLRHSLTAYAVEGNDPATVLEKVSGLVDLARDEHFATALCGILDLGTGIATVANAGHPPLILVAANTAAPVSAPIGPPLGVGSSYDNIEIALTSGDALLAYTDGLVERRGESIDLGIEKLCQFATSTDDLETLLDTVLGALAPQDESQDDTAILGMKWIP